MNDKQRIMIEVLGRTDAAFLPQRSWNAWAGSNRCAARMRYVKNGVEWASGEDEGGRKKAQRLIENLEHDGSLQIFRRPGRKALCLRLSDGAEATTRQLCGLPGLLSALLSARELVKHAKAGYWVSETKLIGDKLPRGQRWGQAAALVEDMALWGLVHGWIDSNSDSAGRVFYCILPAGVEHLGDTASDDDGPADHEARELYLAVLKAEQGRLDSSKPEDCRDIGRIPMSVSGGEIRKPENVPG